MQGIPEGTLVLIYQEEGNIRPPKQVESVDAAIKWVQRHGFDGATDDCRLFKVMAGRLTECRIFKDVF